MYGESILKALSRVFPAACLGNGPYTCPDSLLTVYSYYKYQSSASLHTSLAFPQIGFFAFGYALAFGHNDDDPDEFMGTNLFFLHKFEGREKGVDKAHFFFFLTFCSAAGTIMSGSMAERTKLVPYVVK